MLRRGFEPRSWAREALEKCIDYSKDRENFIIWMNERCSTEHADDMVKHLDRYLTVRADFSVKARRERKQPKQQ